MGTGPMWADPLRWRNIGPSRGGRVVAVAGDPVDRATFYLGACGGGVWKTDDAGTTWRNVSDPFFRTAPVGALAVAPSDRNVIYAGTGEACVRNDVIAGDGVYRSTDGGRSWSPRGLDATRHIARVRVAPDDPERAYVAALGDIFGPGPDRGVYRTTDGGRSWEQVLFRHQQTGACDLWLDPANPRILYAALWQAIRRPWGLESGGPESSLYRTTDGGDSWQELTGRPGFPTALRGRMGVCGAPARAGRVYAVVEAAEGQGGCYRSDDGGDTWERVSTEKGILGRPWYYCHLVPDPADPETLYALDYDLWRSIDGGRGWSRIGTPHGDNHDLWIDPTDPRRMIEGNDGGACVSFNAGASFSTVYNQPTGQFYRVAVDDHFPYRVYGTQQDNSAIRVPSRSRHGAILWEECEMVGHGESGFIAVDPRDDDIVYCGAVGSSGGGGGPLLRYDHRTGRSRKITVWPESGYGEDPRTWRHRFPWTFPVGHSPHDPQVLYTAGERVFRSLDQGQSWEAISPDLTRNDSERLAASGGPITLDTSGAEVYCTIASLAESPLRAGLLWVGTDDGRVQVSRDGGGSWEDVTPPDLPEWTWVAAVEPSPHDADTAYVAANRYRLQDRRPYLFRTTDGGRSWTAITVGILDHHFCRVVRSDPGRPGLLFCGTEAGPYVSFDDGGRWEPLQLNLPAVPVYDLVVKGQDLVAASHGRGFWILDDLTPLRSWTPAWAGSPLTLVVPPVVHRYPAPEGGASVEPGLHYLGSVGAFEAVRRPDGAHEVRVLGAGANPPSGCTCRYWLGEAVAPESISLTVRDAAGAEVVRFQGVRPEPGSVPDCERNRLRVVPATAGGHAFTWNLRHPGLHLESPGLRAEHPDEDDRSSTEEGPLVAPGRYTVELRAGGAVATGAVEVRKDPGSLASDQDLARQAELLLAIQATQARLNFGLARIQRLRQGAAGWLGRGELPAAVRDQLTALVEAATAVEARLTQPRMQHEIESMEHPVGLDYKLAALPDVVASSDDGPTRQAEQVFRELEGRADLALADLERLCAERLPELNRLVLAAGLAAIAGD
ncbi:MAG TPA: glycosyl hydrolase [Candidatus Micrarchaeia archaeon]|nr:glycosyl hydrolase [Candidatus Micrarchaeia archaeon]